MITRYFTFLILLVICMSAQPAKESGIRVNINNLNNDKGHVLISLFKEGEGFPDKAEKAYQKAKLQIKNKTATILFTDMPAGQYAIAMMHDENDDQKMNKNFFGIPKEGYGFSNNVMGTFGPPSYTKASFEHKTGRVTELSIRTRY